MQQFPSIIEEIFQSVLDQGVLTRKDIVDTWALSDESYRDVHRLLVRRREVESGPPGTGGFVARLIRRRDDLETDTPPPLLTAAWELVTVERLEELLKQSELETLVGPLESTIRSARRIRSGKDRPSRKRELASALVIQHGVDLFLNTEIRAAVAQATKLEAPVRWHAGKGRAAAFVTAAGFPLELAGVPANDTLPDMEYLEGRFKLDPLQPFQLEVHRELLNRLSELGHRCLVTLPTGGGKTRVAVESISFWMRDRYDHHNDRSNQGAVLWLAHTEELCEQACACFRQVWEGSDNVCPMTMVRFWGRYTSDLDDQHLALRDAFRRPSVIVSTPQRIANLLEGKTRGSEQVIPELLSALGLIVIDEAHRAAAPTYRRLLESLIDVQRRVSVFGLTATPFRMEYVGHDPEEGTRDLIEVFDKLVEPLQTLGPNQRVALQRMKVLAEPRFETIETNTKMTIPDPPQSLFLSEGEMERIDRVMAIRADNTPRRLQILEHILPLASSESNSILYFGPSVRDAECMAFLLREQGISAAVISGTTRDVTRRQVINDFKSGLIRVLCNCEVLTTGFDAPRVTHVVIARPTVSRVLYEQIVGRGLRGPKFGGTDECVILDCADDFRGERPPLGYESFRRIWYGDEPKIELRHQIFRR
jgi:DNA repair protein RadD